MNRLVPILALCLTLPAAAAERPNVLFISADDLRVEPLAKTPNLDRLAARSRVFTNAHCQQAVCNPSRASLFTGLRPDTLRVWDLATQFRDTTPDAVTLPQHFKNHGYTTIGIGKNFHNWLHQIQGDPQSWSAPEEMHWGPHGEDKPKVTGELPPNLALDPKCECRDVPDEAYIDGRIAARAIARLGELKSAGKPFFLSVGFWKPHAPFNAPKKYWDLYPRDRIPLPDPAGWPEGTDRIAWHQSREILGWGDTPRTLSADAVRELRHGYLAAISYLDAQIGAVLDELAKLGLADNTIVVLWSDHGFHLGEHTLWAKTSNFELDTRVPLLIAAPGLTDPGAPASAPVELLDLYPTLVDLGQLPPRQELEGLSLRPILENPAATVKPAAISQFPRPGYYEGRPEFMGYSVRTATHRYTEWRNWTSGSIIARELYDHQADTAESRNLALDPMKARLLATLAALLPAAAPAADAPPPPPGTVIHHSPAATGLYIGSPSLCIAPDGSYLASHDLFGPKSREYELARGRLYRSTDQGASWSHVRDFDGFFWTGLFVHRGATWLLGTDKHHGRVVIRRSEDSGKTWSEPAVIADGQWHTAPMPVIEHDGRVWRAIEDAHTSEKWGERYRALMMSAPADVDLLDAKSWTFSNALARDTTWLGNDFAAWLEGNAVAAPDGGIVNLLRVDTSRHPEKAAMVRLSKDGRAATFDPVKDFVDLPGGSKKFTIRKDPAGPGYWTLATIVPERHHDDGRPAAVRNTLALLYSVDLRKWETRSILLYHPDVVRHGFQYVDWHFDGQDLIAACRTAWDDAGGGARNNHDANFLTFHRWPDFRSLDRNDDVPMPELAVPVRETANLTLRGSGFEIARLEGGAKAFANRGYRWQDVPAALVGKSFTRLEGGAKDLLEVTAKRDTVVRIATATGQAPVDLGGWSAEPLEFSYDDPGKTKVSVHSRPLKSGDTLRLPRGNWTGAILILDDTL
jgi:iduronate 2-sulfatase